MDEPQLVALRDGVAGRLRQDLLGHADGFVVHVLEHGAPDHLLRSRPQHLGHPAVHEGRHDPCVEVPHALFGRLDDAPVVRLGLRQQPVHPVAVGDVTHRDDIPADVLVAGEVVADELDREPAPVRVLDADEERLLRSGLGRERTVQRLDRPIPVVRVDQVQRVAPQERAHRRAHAPLGGLVGVGDHPMLVDHEDHVGRALDEGAISLPISCAHRASKSPKGFPPLYRPTWCPV